MSDTPNAPAPQLPVVVHPPFPFVRLLFSLFYGAIAWLVLHVICALAVVQFVMIAINGRVHEEIKGFCASLIQYEWELLSYITFARDEQPFPVGPFPKRA